MIQLVHHALLQRGKGLRSVLSLGDPLWPVGKTGGNLFPGQSFPLPHEALPQEEPYTDERSVRAEW